MSTHIVFIGGGNMALAMAGGLLQADHPAAHITVSDPALERRQLAAQLGLRTEQDNAIAAATADVVILAVKPHLIGPVCQALTATIAKRQPLVVSIAAGITIDTIARHLNGHQRIVRVMPNTPALVRRGASGLFAGSDVQASDRGLVTGILTSVGDTVWVDDENDLHSVTAISGSGPAYFFLFMEHLEREAQQLGLGADAAALLVRSTAAGAAAMAQQADVSLAELRRRVTSPGGTTEAAIGAFTNNDLAQLVHNAVGAARERSIELAQSDGDD